LIILNSSVVHALMLRVDFFKPDGTPMTVHLNGELKAGS